MNLVKIKKKLKELENSGISRDSIAKIIDIRPLIINKLLKEKRNTLDIAAKILTFMCGTDKLDKVKIDGITEEILTIKEHSTGGKIKFYGTLPADEEILYEKVISKTDNVLKLCQSVKEIPDKLKQLSEELSEKYQNKIQIPYWIGAHLFQIFQSSNVSNIKNKQGDTFLYCSTYQEESIVLDGIIKIIKYLLIKIEPESLTWKEIDYRILALNLEGHILIYKGMAENSSKSYLQGMQLGINWLGTQKISETSNYLVWKRLLELALNNLHTALYSNNPKLIADAKNFFILLDKDFSKPGNVVGDAIQEKISEVMRERIPWLDELGRLI